MITYVFPGQGSQKQGMGSGLFDEFKELTDQADEILGYSIKRLCLENPYSNLNKTQFTQPALYVVNALSYLKKSRMKKLNLTLSPGTAWVNTMRYLQLKPLILRQVYSLSEKEAN